MSVKRILVEDGLVLTPLAAMSNPVLYIRADLVDRLKRYLRHSDSCLWRMSVDMTPCTCGLTEVLREME